jgi:hypothetical protein
LRSKQYCIANQQYTKEEYLHLKEQLLGDYFAQLGSEGAFRTLKDVPGKTGQ